MNKSKTIEQTLKAFKKSNKKRRQRMAERAGYLTADIYKAHLEGKVIIDAFDNRKLQTPTTPPSNPVNNGDSKPTIHIVSILDASTSMYGDKFENALRGINSEIKELKKETTINYTLTMVRFSGTNNIQTIEFKTPISKVGEIYTNCTGMTALYQAVGETLEKFINTPSNEKVLVKIFTDGENNESRGKYASQTVLANFIKECESKGFTITFVGTKTDVDFMINDLNINFSNTLSHDNTSRGVADAFATTTMATKSYSAKVLNNEDVLTGFYKQEGTL